MSLSWAKVPSGGSLSRSACGVSHNSASRVDAQTPACAAEQSRRRFARVWNRRDVPGSNARENKAIGANAGGVRHVQKPTPWAANASLNTLRSTRSARAVNKI